ncbi:MAG TPA: class I SAM-dependent methyltransferase [Thermoanaerobaculia bacterium]|jgi:SAM-dependent methyltransferase|nr:class I SAM-dependent methyltransferase [Thermoanaerobaculia bacterium]
MNPRSEETTHPVIHGRRPQQHEKEHSERTLYDSGQAELDAAQVAGPSSEPWLNVLAAHEPASMEILDWILSRDDLRQKVRGDVLDAGAGTCWLTARVSLLPQVERVFALDLSERFLTTVGTRVMTVLGGDLSKVTFVESDFNAIPLATGSLDCAFLFGAIHHSLSPIKTLQEIGRCLKPGGLLLMLENPASPLRIGMLRERALAASGQVTEICYTRAEIEYLIANARIGKCQVLPGPLRRSFGFKALVRRSLRRLHLEHVLLNPPNYLFLIERS